MYLDEWEHKDRFGMGIILEVIQGLGYGFLCILTLASIFFVTIMVWVVSA